MPIGNDGFRGAVLLTKGTYKIAGSIQIRAYGQLRRAFQRVPAPAGALRKRPSSP